MNYTNTVGVTKYNGKFEQILKAKSKTMSLWPSKLVGALAGDKSTQSPGQIYMDKIFVGEATIKKISERESCRERKFHCITGTERSFIKLSHFIEMNEQLDKCGLKLYSTALAEGKASIRSKIADTMAMMTDDIVDKYDNIVLRMVEATAPRLASDDTVTVDNILSKIEEAVEALTNDEELPVKKTSDVHVVVPLKYEKMYKEAVMKKFAAGNVLERKELQNGIKVYDWAGADIQFWEEAQAIIATTRRGVMHVLACYNGIGAFDTNDNRGNFEIMTDFACGAGYPVQFLEGIDDTPIIKEVVVVYEATPATGSRPMVVQSPNENDGLEIVPAGTEEKFNEAVKTAKTEKDAAAKGGNNFEIKIKSGITVPDTTVVDKKYLTDNKLLEVIDVETGLSAVAEANVTMNPTSVTATKGSVQKASISVKTTAGMYLVKPFAVVGEEVKVAADSVDLNLDEGTEDSTDKGE